MRIRVKEIANVQIWGAESLTFVERIGNADSIALALHLSRPTYYRMLKQSLVNLCTVLQSGDFLSATLE